VVKGTRISVELIVDLLANGWTPDQILDSYPQLTADDVRACLAYASEILHAEKVYPIKTRGDSWRTRTFLARPLKHCEDRNRM
jgi:hypothetical protein